MKKLSIVDSTKSFFNLGLTERASLLATFNPDKCIFKQDSISFYGVTLSSEGVKPDPRKIETIKNLPDPKSEALLQSFLGMLTICQDSVLT